VIEQIDSLLSQARAELSTAADEQQVEAARVKYLGKHGSLSGLRKGMGAVPAADRPKMGKLVTDAIAQFEALLEETRKSISARALQADLQREKLDVTLPGRTHRRGHRHPVSQALDDIVEIFARLGFHKADGPEIEWDIYNFEKLGIPADHPARDMQDTLYLEAPVRSLAGTPATLLRTHTSGMQIRYMEQHPPPVRLIAPGRVYRRDNLDLTHTPMFTQVEGLVVGEGVSLADLKGTLFVFLRELFGEARELRFRPSFFPYTEPSAEVDISCGACGGTGRDCGMCKRTGWIEILGSGMVHPAVFQAVGYDADRYTGFAFGLGIERVALLKWGVEDIRLFYENDLRFLEQFPL